MNCAFCKKNGETQVVYTSHKLRDENGSVTCPVLKQYTCPHCQLTGQHTASYCPKRRAQKKEEQKLQPAAAKVMTHQQTPPKRAFIKESPPSPPPKLPLLLPDSNLPQAKLDQLLTVANRMQLWYRLPYLLHNGYSKERYLALQRIVLMIY